MELTYYLVATPLLVLGICALFAFVGCDRVYGLSSASVGTPGSLQAEPDFPATVAGIVPVKLTWNAATDADTYNVKRGTQAGGPYTLLGQVMAPTTTYLDLSVTDGTQFFYVVTASGGGDESSPSNEAAATPEPAFVTGLSFGNIPAILTTGFLGMTIDVQGSNLNVYAVGRLRVDAANSAIHEIRIVDPANPSGHLASIQVDLSMGNVGAFVYARFPSSITLQAGQSYYIVSQELNGGDNYYNDGTRVSTTAVAQVVNSVFSTNAAGTAYKVSNTTPGASFGPLDFLWTV